MLTINGRRFSLEASSTTKLTLAVPDIYGCLRVAVIGDLTAWVPIDMPFDGTHFSVDLVLPRDRSWHYRFRVDESSWINDFAADDYERCVDGGAVSVRRT
jgi:hypothetical protein